MDPVDAARDIPMDDFATWGDPERLVVNVITLYREFAGDTEHPSRESLFGHMATLAGYGT